MDVTHQDRDKRGPGEQGQDAYSGVMIMTDTTTVYVVRDYTGEYVRENGSRTPCSDQAKEFETFAEAKEACTRSTDKVLSRDAE